VEKEIMAGMFYSLQETAERLSKTEDEVRQLAKDGKLREFRDGSNLLFKIDEVNALAAENLDSDLGLELEPLEAGPDLEAVAEASAEEPAEDEMMLNLTAEEPSDQPQVVEPDLDATSELGLAPSDDDTTAVSDADLVAGLSAEEPAAPAEEMEDISLAAESGALGVGSDITDMDTALSGEGINVLAESGLEDATADSMASTVGPAGTSTEASLEEIEEDVNLDSFGSGSGLLDLSLQADDTSLGGILDEIYTSEGGQEGQAPAAEHGSVEDITAEAEHVITPDTTELVATSEPIMPIAPVATHALVEVPPDTQSNMLGMLLFLPLLALLYTAIVAAAAMRGAIPSIMAPIQGLIWYIVGGGIVVSLVVFALSFSAGRERTKAAPRAKKEKASKTKTAKKEKPAKAPKAEKPAKEAKPKKSFFGKKK
jgi:hypothetical protein